MLISALEHYSYCPSQCGLIHVEQTFDENLYTMRRRIVHERVDAALRGVRVMRAVPLWSEQFALRGKADVVELLSDGLSVMGTKPRYDMHGPLVL